MKITIVSNNNKGRPSRDGARAKLHNVMRGFKELGYDIDLIDVSEKTKVFSIIHRFFKALKNDGVVIITLAVNGSRTFLKLSSLVKRKARFVLCPVGIGPVRKVFEGKLSGSNLLDFMNGRSFFGLEDKKMGERLKKVDAIAVESAQLKNLYEKFYGLENVEILPNFRFLNDSLPHKPFSKDRLNTVFLSRVHKNKGILNLMACVRALNERGKNVFLDIYGDVALSDDDKKTFDSYLSESICYKGTADNSKAIEVMSQYDLHCLPTSPIEGVPGSIIEAIMATTPTLCTDVPSVGTLIDDNKDGFVVPVQDSQALIDKLDYIYNHLDILPSMSEMLKERRKSYSFFGQRDLFLRILLG